MMEEVNRIRRGMVEVPKPLGKYTKEQVDDFCDEFYDIKKKSPEMQKKIIRKALDEIVVFDDHLDLYTAQLNRVCISVYKTGRFRV